MNVRDYRRTVRIVVHGRVQGVGFREVTRRFAEERGVCGWIRNCEDGSVTGMLQGSAESVEAVLAFVRVGPRGALVSTVEIDELNLHDGSTTLDEQEYFELGDRFEIRRG